MSFLAIGSVTKAIAELLARKMNKPPLLGSSVFRVTTLPPDDERVDDADGINLFLYRVAINPFLNNMEWRGDRVNPSASRRPPLALNLNYMLTAYARKGDGAAQDDVTAHQLLGNAMSILHEYPVLNDIHDSDYDASLDTQFAAELRNSFEKVKLSIIPTTMEEFSKIWTGFSKAYRLSVIYEVSLVQIAPTAAAVPAPPVQTTIATIETLATPFIESITPAEGAVGTEVVIRGSNFTSRTAPTVVEVGDETLGADELTSLDSNLVAFRLPEAVQTGEQLPIRILTGNRASARTHFRVSPWIGSLQPLRGINGIPLTIPYELPPETPVKVEIGGVRVDATYDAGRKIVSATVPGSLKTNGLHAVALLVGVDPQVRTNARFFELLPTIESVSVLITNEPASTTITVKGRRLQGTETSIRYGGLLLRKGTNETATELSYTVAGRTLPDKQPASVVIDGRESNVVPPLLESIEPSEARAGQTITLKGRGLSGRYVTVKFGTTGVQLAPQGFASQLTVTVPSSLAPGRVQVKVTVSGDTSNKLPLKVLA